VVGSVKRFSYLPPAPTPAPVTLPTLAVDNRIRGPLAALLGTLVLTLLVSFVQLARLEAASRVDAAAVARLAADEPALRDLAALHAQVVQLRALSESVGEIRRSSLARANELAWIGNQLPPGTWLTAVRFEDGAYTLEGSADRAPAIGLAMTALRDDAHALNPQLVSLHDDPTPSGRRVRYTVRLEVSR
jgi:Tfp pilus assembly protein PilN